MQQGFLIEARSLEEKLGEAAMGRAFLLQGGDCAESFKEFNANNIRDTFRILLQMGAVLMFGGQMPVVKVGRMAGQFAKPRSDPFEEKDGVKLPSYMGDNVNGDAFDAKYRELAHRVDEALGFMSAAGLTVDHPIMKTTNFWTSHECLHLPYEQSLTRLDSTSGLYYDCSAHFLWAGEHSQIYFSLMEQQRFPVVTSAAATAVRRLTTLLAKLGLNPLVAILALLPALLHPPMVAFFFFAAAGWAASSFFCCLFLVRLLALLSAHVLYPLPLQWVAEVQALLVLGEGGIGVFVAEFSSQSVAVSGEKGKEQDQEDKGLKFGGFDKHFESLKTCELK
nr:phospho-2-dehydro-3-deoxyheptonate aldolase 1, chloroplastic-like [Ipomoea batatas]